MCVCDPILLNLKHKTPKKPFERC